MSRRDWILVISLVFIVLFLDQVTKAWALANLSGLRFYGPLGLVLHRNPGAMLGMFSDLPPILRVVSLSTGGAFLIFIYGAIQYLLRKRTLSLRTGMSILLGGILGNVTDRILSGSVVDFIVFRVAGYSSPAFNVSDAVQWVGYFMIVLTLVAQGQHLWPEQNERKRIWVNLHFQLKYVGVLIAIGLAFAMISAVFSFTFLKITIDDLVIGNPQAVERKFILPFLITYGIICVSFLIALFVIGRVLSHRVAGPVYAFQLFLEDLLKGKDRPLRLRTGDEFAHLEQVSEQLRQLLRNNFSKIDLPLPAPEEPRTGTDS